MSRQSRLVSAAGIAVLLATSGVVGTGTAHAADTTAPVVRIVAPSINGSADASPMCPDLKDPLDPNRIYAIGPYGLHAVAGDPDGVLKNVQFLYDYTVPGQPVQHAVGPILTKSPWFFQLNIALPSNTLISVVARAENEAGLSTLSSPVRYRVKPAKVVSASPSATATPTATASPTPSASPSTGQGDEATDTIPSPLTLALPADDRVKPDVLLYPAYGNPAPNFRDCFGNRPNLADVQATYFFARNVNDSSDPVVIGGSAKAPFDFLWKSDNPVLPPVPGNQYQVTVVGYGFHGSKITSPTRTLTIAAVTGETTPPTGSFTYPPANATFNEIVEVPAPSGDDNAEPSKQYKLTADVSASDSGSGVASVELFDNGGFVARDTTAPYHFEWTTPVTGKHELTARILDNENNSFTTPKRVVFVEAPIASVAKTFVDGFTLKFSQPVVIPTDTSISLRLRDTDVVVPALVGCGEELAPCGDTPTTQAELFTTQSYLMLGEFYEIVMGSDVEADTGAPVSPQVLVARGPLSVNDDSVLVQQRWRVSTTQAAWGGHFLSEHLAGASLTYFWTGSKITWYTTQGPAFGKANVFIDGKIVAIVNNGATKTSFRVPAWNSGNLARGEHRLDIQVRGEKGLLSGVDSLVAVDAFRIDEGVDFNPRVFTTWREVQSYKAFNGQISETDSRGSAAVVYFRGTTIDWYTVISWTMGRAQVVIDGRVVATVDNYSPTTHFKIRRRFSVPDGVHKFEVRPLQQKTAASKDDKVAVDAFFVS